MLSVSVQEAGIFHSSAPGSQATTSHLVVEQKLGEHLILTSTCPFNNSSYVGRTTFERLQLKMIGTVEKAKSVLRFLPICDENFKKIITGVLVRLKPNLALNLRGKHSITKQSRSASARHDWIYSACAAPALEMMLQHHIRTRSDEQCSSLQCPKRWDTTWPLWELLPSTSPHLQSQNVSVKPHVWAT